ncbi:MAG: SAM-dependent methlyltransferase [Acidimicrobiales bacterium]|nr:SAM-dependent methlyltransferase [Acidimicrobiales bacterium]
MLSAGPSLPSVDVVTEDSGGSNDSGEATADSSEATAELYDEHPYPAHGVVSGVVARLVSGCLGDLLASGRPVRVLDAGCGTGEQTLGLKRAFPAAEVVGVDLNERSLELAREYRGRHGIDVQFERADLLAPVEGLGSFDLIVSIGVLHHLAEPELGLRTLRALSAPGGRLLAMLYGRYGKQPLFDARDALASIDPAAGRDERLRMVADLRSGSNAGIAHYASELVSRRRFGPDIAPVEALRRVAAGRNAAYQADAYTHPQEQAFTVGEAGGLLGSAGWRLDGWPARSGLPDAATDVFREPTATSVEALPLVDRAGVYERLVRPSNLYLLSTAVDDSP